MGIPSQFKSLKITSTPPKSPRVIPNSDATNQEMPSSTSASQWIYETVKGSHEFKIKGYSLAKGIGVGESMTSREFTVGGYDWVVEFYPEGVSESCEEYISLFLRLVSPKKQVRALCELKLLDQTGNGIHSIRARSISPKTYNTDESWYARGCPIPPIYMILALHELPETHEISDSDSLCTSTIVMQHLLAAADRFDLARLRLMCEEKLCEGITVDTVATTLALAEQHQYLQLKTFCLNFVAKANNLEGKC
ncbi:hypothetical protein MKW92_028785 [Papaver armeniacum]|nr:hypothetical protein MKW92_028785 [Papaver armeniacum]